MVTCTLLLLPAFSTITGILILKGLSVQWFSMTLSHGAAFTAGSLLYLVVASSGIGTGLCFLVRLC